MRFAVVALTLAACGRLDFGSQASPTDGRVPRACGQGVTAPDPVTISGVTFEYSDFVNDKRVVTNTVVTATSPTGDVLAMTTSDANGNYALSIATGGVAIPLSLTFQPFMYFTTTEILDAPLDRDTVGLDLIVWSAGDGPVWSSSAMGSVYSTSSVTLDPTKSTLTVTTTDCAGNALEGVAITVDPMPDELDYLGPNGLPDLAAIGTIGPNSQMVGFDAQPGTTHITASKSGYVFADQTVEIPAGDVVTMIEMRPIE